jgi:pimeloyl-ACP methyl ester carboxylesterase
MTTTSAGQPRVGRLLTAGVCACLSMITGCGGSASSRAPSQTPAVVNTCVDAGSGWHKVSSVHVDAAQLGSGPAVVFANDSGNTACGWLPVARSLAAQRFRVAVFTYFDFSESQSMTDMLAVARAVGGGGHYALVGASLGGRLVIEAAARRPAGLAAIVSLSGERMIDSYPDILPQARQVRAPTLYVGAREDPLTDGSRQQRELHQAMRGNPNEIIQLDGIEHGTDLLDRSAPDGKAVSARMIAFLQSQLR